MSSPIAVLRPSNALTYGSLMTSIAALAAAAQGSTSAAAAFVAVSVIADTFDGRFARLFDRTKVEASIGVQLDSLSDAVAFGFVPGGCTLLLAMRLGPPRPAVWIALSLFAAAAVTRLAYYNAHHDEQDGFIGLPVPVAALLWATALLVRPDAAISIAVLMTAGVAMVLPLRIPRPRGAGLALFAAWPLLVACAALF